MRILLEMLLNHCSSNGAVFVRAQVGSKMEADEKRVVKTKYKKYEIGKENFNFNLNFNLKYLNYGPSELRYPGASAEETTVDFSIWKMQRYCDNCEVQQVGRYTQVWVAKAELVPSSCINGAKVSTVAEAITRRLNRREK